MKFRQTQHYGLQHGSASSGVLPRKKVGGLSGRSVEYLMLNDVS